jgi:hypothetical protein
MMAAATYNFTIEQGATFSKVITWKDSTGAGINLTGYTITGKIKRKTSDSNALATFTATLANQGASPGQFTLSLTATQTGLLPTAVGGSAEKVLLECVYDVEATTGSTVTRLLEGIVSISPEATR